MPKRKTRQVIVDRLEAAAALIERADDKLAQATAIYYEHGTKEGALLDLIREGVQQSGAAVKKFRYERA